MPPGGPRGVIITGDEDGASPAEEVLGHTASRNCGRIDVDNGAVRYLFPWV